MEQTWRVSWFLRWSVAVGGLFCLPACAQNALVSGVSPAASVSLAASIAQSGQADVHLSAATSTTNRPALARFASGTGNVLYLAAGTLLPLVEDGKNGKDHAFRTADALLTSTLITEGLKRIVREKRPDSNARDSFPSGHATAAFAVATMESHYHPKQAIFWYAGAAGIAYSRVTLRRHFTQDILAGAAIGILTARFEIQQPRGFILAPFIKSRNEGGGSGISISKSF